MSDRKSHFSKDRRLFIQKALLAWYQKYHRPLPWRTVPSLYRTVVSEFMCQQTQIDTVLPYFARWMLRFPDFPALAAAPEADVLKHWEGLGYYNRARNLHRLAQQFIRREHPPHSPEEWRELPGIGPYTSAAIASITNHYPAAVVDGNVIRVLARLTNTRTPFKSNGEAALFFQPHADDLINPQNPGDHNQAMMELGATLCTKHNPSCTICPLQPQCLASTQSPESIPLLQRPPTIKVTLHRLYLTDQNNLLLHQADPTSKRLAHLYEFPRFDQINLPVPNNNPLLTKTRGISNQRITEHFHSLPLSKSLLNTIAQTPNLHWIPKDQLPNLTLSGPHRKWLPLLEATLS